MPRTVGPDEGGHGVVHDPAEDLDGVVVAAWGDVFPDATVTLDSDFDALGGRSIHLVKIASAVEATTGLALPPAQLFESQTPRLMVEALRGSVGSR